MFLSIFYANDYYDKWWLRPRNCYQIVDSTSLYRMAYMILLCSLYNIHRRDSIIIHGVYVRG